MGPVTYQLSEADYLGYLRLHTRSQWPVFVAMALYVVIGFICLAWFLEDFGSLPEILAGTVAAFIGLGMLAYYIRLPRSTAKTWREYALIKEPMTRTQTDDGFTINQPSAHIAAKWGDMVKWDEDDGIFAIYVTRQSAYIMPKCSVPTDHVDFARQRLIASGLPQRRKLRK